MTWRDLTALPCSHPHCCSVGYLLRDDSGTWQSLTALIGHDRLKQWLDLEPDLLANRIADDAIPAAMKEVVKGSLLDLLSEQSSLSHPSMADDLARHLPELRPRHRHPHARWPPAALPGQHERLRAMLGERVLRVTVKPFMDMNTMIEERLTQCCVHVATVNGETRRPPVRAVLRGAGLGPAERAPGSRPRVGWPLLTRGPSSDPRLVDPDRAERRARRTTRSGSASSPPSPCSAGCWAARAGVLRGARHRRLRPGAPGGAAALEVPAGGHPQRARVPRPARRTGSRGPGVGALVRFCVGAVARVVMRQMTDGEGART